MANPLHFDPMGKIFELWRQFDSNPLVFQNLNIRGNMITIYLPIDEMLAYVNLLQSRDYAENRHENIWVHKGYAKGGNYFRIGPYYLRIAQYREKLHNQQDAAYLHEQYRDQVSNLEKELHSAAVYIQKLLDRLAEIEKINKWT